MIESVTVPEGTRGPWSVKRFSVESNSIGSLRAALKGRPIDEGEYTKLVHQRRGLIMSDTPAERRDHFSFVYQAKNHVLMNGLGIGMCLAAVLKKDEVTKATVVEIDADLIDLVGPHYTNDPRVEIICCDASKYQIPKNTRYGAVWHDIWDAICEDNLPEMHRLHRKYGRHCDWQGSWARGSCERGAFR